MKHKHSANSLVPLIVICAMIASLFCIGGLSASADDTIANEAVISNTSTLVPLDSFSGGTASGAIEYNDPNNDGEACALTVFANKSGDAANAKWITASNNPIGFEFGSEKTYVFWAVVKGTPLTSGNIYFNAKVDGAYGNALNIDLNSAAGVNEKTWTKIYAKATTGTTTIKMSENVIEIKFCAWVKNSTSTDMTVLIDSIGYAEYDTTAGEVISGTEKSVNLSLLTTKTDTTATFETVTVLNDIDKDTDNEMMKLIAVKSSSTQTTQNSNSAKATLSVTKGRKYQISFYMLSNDTLHNANLPIDGTVTDYDNNGWGIKSTTGGVWKKYMNTFTAVDESIQIRFWLGSRTTSDVYIYIDQFVIKDITNAIPLSDYESTSLSGGKGAAEIVEGGLDSDNEQLKVTVNAGVSAGKSVNFDGFNPGALYNVKMYVKGSGFNSGNIYANSPAAQNTKIEYAKFNISDFADWQEISFENIQANTNGIIEIGFWLNNAKDAENSKNFYIDEITVAAQKTFDMDGASIRTETDNQDLKFNVGLSTDGVAAENWNVTEYGMIFTPAQRFSALGITDVSELTLELAEQYPNYIIVSSETVTDGAVPTAANFTLNGSSNTPILNGGSSCGVKICARAYYKYTYNTTSGAVEGVIYSDNTLAADDTATGSEVESGVATRSVYGIAKAMGAKLFEAEGITLAEGTVVADYVDGVFYDANSTAVANADILAFVVANRDAVNQIVGG